MRFRAPRPLVRLRRRWGEWELRRRGLLDLLAARPADAIAPDFGDLWFLYRLVRRRKPHIVLEFGSGASTVILAAALRDNGKGFLHSLDAEPARARSTFRMLQPLRRFASVTVTPLERVVVGGTPACRHVARPDVTPDLIYLDGPSTALPHWRSIDLLDIEVRLKPGALLVVDGRETNVGLLRRHVRRSWRFVYRAGFGYWVITLLR